MAPPSQPWVFVCGASRGLGRALTRRLLATTRLPVLATTRSADTAGAEAALLSELEVAGGAEETAGRRRGRRRLTVVRCDVRDEASVRAAAAAAAGLFPPTTHHLHLGCAVAGVLHAERAPGRVDAGLALESFRVNAVGPLVLAKHFFPLLPRRGRWTAAAAGAGAGDGNGDDSASASDSGSDSGSDSASASASASASPLGPLPPRHATWLAVAARVGSTTDNRAGGWFSYRASKAAVISLARSLDLFLEARSGPRALALAYHPGTVRTDFSRDYWAGVAPDRLFSPEYAAERLVDVVARLRLDQRGRCWDWKGEEVPP